MSASPSDHGARGLPEFLELDPDLTTDSQLVHFHIVVEDEDGTQVVLS